MKFRGARELLAGSAGQAYAVGAIGWSASYVALWILVAFQTVVLLGLVRTVVGRGEMGSAAQDGPNGNLRNGRAPGFTSVDISGHEIDSSDFRGHLTGLVFVSPTCTACTLTLDELDAVSLKANGRLVIICQGGMAECSELVQSHGVCVPVVADEEREISALFGVSAVPTAILIDEDLRIRSYGHPMRGDDLARMISARPSGGNGA